MVFCIFFLIIYLCIDIFTINELKEFFSLTWSIEDKKYGILVPLLGSFIISFLALILGFIFSFSLSSIIFLANSKFIKLFLEKTVLLMATIPTVIYAFSALFIFVPFISYFKPSSTLSILVASVVLSLLLIPTMSLIFLNIFNTLAQKYMKCCLNLSLSKEEFFFSFVIKNSTYHLAQGFLLATTRALGDTMVVLMLAGNALFLPSSIFHSTRSLTSHIALIFANDFESMAFKAIFLCALLLLSSNFILILIIRKIKANTYEI
ncbi:PstC family ABC transporter permease [Malaciobacter mytili]|uniref:PstC family ABC transporter permease n=1 Tax=Malaciobacter mytili TaxID=603050 RepID=UPI0013E92671|nr:ABC transporter permease subunit [Malaciobacter mytili]